MNTNELMTLIDLTPLMEAIISLVFLVIGAYLVPILKNRRTEDEWAKLKAFVHVGVYAAEKLFGAGHGAEKLAHVEKYLLEVHGVKLDSAKLLALVNAELKEMEQSEPVMIG